MTEKIEKSPPYYPIREDAAKRAKGMNSFYDYEPGSATAEYRRCVDEAATLAERQKSRVDPMYHEKIDRLLDTCARKLADNMNAGFAIDARVPSILIAGGSNFPVRQKEKQNAARNRNMGNGAISRARWIKSAARAWVASAPMTPGHCQTGKQTGLNDPT